VGSREELEARARSIFGNRAEEFLELSEQENGQYGRVSGLECTIKGAFGKRKEDGGLQNYYYYKFAPEIPGWDKPGCFHSVDLWFFFETLAKCWRPFTGKHYDLARQMCDYWANFIKNGNPNGVDANGEPMPEWAPYSNSQAAEMVFTTDGAAPAVGNTPLVKFLSQWMVREHEGYIKVYTRQPDADCYPGGLSYSIHMAGSRDGRVFHPFNKNYGILFAEAEIRQDDTICPKGVKEPQIFSMKAGGYGIAAVRTDENGETDGSAAGKLLLWKTEDFISFEYVGLVDTDEVKRLRAEEEIPGNAPDCLEIDADTFARAEKYWSPVVNTGVIVPECVAVRSPGELERIRALAVYSDGSSSLKRVIWEKDGIDFSVPGIYEVQGSVVDKSHPFPLAKGYGDPVLFRWEGKWYYISTNDNMDDIGLYVREADTVGGLFEEGITDI
ncbi:MAG: carboxylesterase family protein, partial [Lachnospiraceae bacterium]|nr:carboxylesterase family protein [Lachnospiraceae bacterium]